MLVIIVEKIRGNDYMWSIIEEINEVFVFLMFIFLNIFLSYEVKNWKN